MLSLQLFMRIPVNVNTDSGHPESVFTFVRKMHLIHLSLLHPLTSVVDPKNWTVWIKPNTVQKGDSTDAKTSFVQTRIQSPRDPAASHRREIRCPDLPRT